MAFGLGHGMLADCIKRADDTEIQASLMPFLLNRREDRQIATASRQACDKYLRRIVLGPFNIHQKILIISALLGQPATFEAEVNAADLDDCFDDSRDLLSEYSVAFCRELGGAFSLTKESIGNGTEFNDASFAMTNRIPRKRMPRILEALMAPSGNPHNDFIASWMLNHLDQLDEFEDLKCQGIAMREAVFAMKLFVKFKDAFDKGDWEHR